jgi:hypothetical protein
MLRVPNAPRERDSRPQSMSPSLKTQPPTSASTWKNPLILYPLCSNALFYLREEGLIELIAGLNKGPMKEVDNCSLAAIDC